VPAVPDKINPRLTRTWNRSKRRFCPTRTRGTVQPRNFERKCSFCHNLSIKVPVTVRSRGLSFLIEVRLNISRRNFL
jgi:hypothetical protein